MPGGSFQMRTSENAVKAEVQLRRPPLLRTWVNKGKKKGQDCYLLLGGATYTFGGTWERLGEERPNATRGAISDEVLGGGISSVDIVFGAVINRCRQASEEDVGLVAPKPSYPRTSYSGFRKG